MVRHLVIVLIALFLLAADAPDAANKNDIEKWQGTWRAVSFITDGKSTDPAKLLEIKLTVTGTEYHFQNGNYSEHGSYRFDAAKNPKQLDIVVGDGPDKGKVHQVIYQVDDKHLTICLDAAGKRRPTKFDATQGEGLVLEQWTRQQP